MSALGAKIVTGFKNVSAFGAGKPDFLSALGAEYIAFRLNRAAECAYVVCMSEYHIEQNSCEVGKKRDDSPYTQSAAIIR